MTDTHSQRAEARASNAVVGTHSLASSLQGLLEVTRAVREAVRSDDRLHPGDRVMRLSPFGDPPVEDSLTPPE